MPDVSAFTGSAFKSACFFTKIMGKFLPFFFWANSQFLLLLLFPLRRLLLLFLPLPLRRFSVFSQNSPHLFPIKNQHIAYIKMIQESIRGPVRLLCSGIGDPHLRMGIKIRKYKLFCVFAQADVFHAQNQKPLPKFILLYRTPTSMTLSFSLPGNIRKPFPGSFLFILSVPKLIGPFSYPFSDSHLNPHSADALSSEESDQWLLCDACGTNSRVKNRILDTMAFQCNRILMRFFTLIPHSLFCAACQIGGDLLRDLDHFHRNP